MSRLSDEEKLSETAQLLQGVEPTEEYSLEDILAEFGQGAAEPAPEPAPKPEPTPAPEPEPDIPPEPDPADPPEPQPPAEEEPEPPAKPEPPEPEEAPEEPEEEPEEQPEEAPEEEPPKISIEQVMSETVSAVLEETDDEILEEREPLRERASGWCSARRSGCGRCASGGKNPAARGSSPEREEPDEPLEPEPDMDTAAREEKQLRRRLRKDLLHLSIPTALLIVLSVCDGLGFVPAVWQELDVLRGAVMGAGLLVSILLARPVWLEALEKLRARHIGCEAACAVVCAVCLAHCVFVSIAGGAAAVRGLRVGAAVGERIRPAAHERVAVGKLPTGRPRAARRPMSSR